ncbi:MAG: zinc-ribbon domain-containing protein, partial [Actinobacteria bacterium]|nr:zinc-ribbon domain-containing protein [Actinomycetota bacterium]
MARGTHLTHGSCGRGMMHCTNCGQPLEEGAAFCKNCGAAVPQS